jgi:pimeloyl-ACP methyl ester carboxylesterase
MSANLIGEYVPQAEVKIYEKAAHGLYLTHAEKVLEEVVTLVSGL